MSAVHETHIERLPLVHRGKVRDIYDAGPDHLLIITTDRLSAFDVVLPRAIPGKGRVLTELTEFWMRRFADRVPSQMAPDRKLEELLNADEVAEFGGQSRIVRRLRAIPVECVARGYLIGSGWKDYQRTGSVCGIDLPSGLSLADKLPTPIFTPADKAPVGSHDENISFEQAVDRIGAELAETLKALTLDLYATAARFAAERGIIVADTKFEFGLDDAGKVHLIDEVLTPDSSRFWPVESWNPGQSPPSFDKQIVRDWLEAQDWDKTAPGPWLPDDIAERTSARYREVSERLMASISTQ